MMSNKKLVPDEDYEESLVQPESLYSANKSYYRACKRFAREIDKAPRLWRQQYQAIRAHLFV